MTWESVFDASPCTASVSRGGTSLWAGSLAKGQVSPVFNGAGGASEPLQLAVDGTGIVTLQWQDGGTIQSDGYAVSIAPADTIVLSQGRRASAISCHIADASVSGMAADVVTPPTAMPLTYTGTPPGVFSMSPNPADLSALPGAVSISVGMGATSIWPLVRWVDGATQDSDSNAFSVTFTKPVVAGDVIFMVCTETKNFNLHLLTPPAGWTVLTSGFNGANTGALLVLYRICDGTENGATYTFTAGASETGHWTAQWLCIEAGTYSFDPTKYAFQNMSDLLAPPVLAGHGGACFVSFLIDATHVAAVTQWAAPDHQTSITNSINGCHVCTQYSYTQASSLVEWLNADPLGWHWVATVGLSRSA